jgi:Holliday junction resolvasome RuvABC DNA-binding subunit
VIELRDKVGELASSGSAAAVPGSPATGSSDDVFEDALSALVNLGYQRNAAEKALQQSAKDGTEMSVQKMLRAALQRLAR